MAFFGKGPLSRWSSRLGSLRNYFVGRPCRSAASKAYRRPHIDPLEDRVLLSVSPLDPTSILVNQVFGVRQETTAGQSVAVADNGDFVVAWTRWDKVLDTAGNVVIDARTGKEMVDANIYARYFTDEVQRVSLPLNISRNFDDDSVTTGRFSLKYNAQTIQKLTVTAGTYPLNDPTLFRTQQPEFYKARGTFTLWFDADRDQVRDPAELIDIVFNELDPAQSAKNLQEKLRGMPAVVGGDNSQIVVSISSPQEYLIDFGEPNRGLDQPQLRLISDDPLNHPFELSGFLPGVSVTTVQRPFTLDNIPVSQYDANETAVAIESYFKQSVAAYSQVVAPFDFPTPERTNATTQEAPYNFPVASMVTTDVDNPTPERGFDPSVTVRPVLGSDGKLSLTEFDIWFTGTSGKKIHAPLVVTGAVNEELTNLQPDLNAKVNVLKQSSPEFRVNAAEPDNAFTLGPDVTDQDQAAVAIDPDGDFVIAWRSVVPNSVTPGSVTDIYARRFTPVGITGSYAPGTYVPGLIATGVRALPVPTAVSVQRLIFDASGAVPLTGKFRLRIGDTTTGNISFNSANLTATATSIQNALVSAGHRGVVVSVIPTPSKPTRFRFDVRFAGEPGVEQPPIEYVAYSTPLKATVASVNFSGDIHTFRVNTSTANPQAEPAVAMDESGGFVIVWSERGQDVSFFNGIEMQRYDRDGELVGPEVRVDTERTEIDYAPDVAMGRDGYTVVSWTETSDPTFGFGSSLSNVYVRGFDPTSRALFAEINVGGGGGSTVSMDSRNNFTVSWNVGNDPNDATVGDQDNSGNTSAGIRARQFAMMTAAGAVLAAPQEVRTEFRVNSGSVDPASATVWPFDQVTAQVVADIDGDLVFTYEGHGADASDDVDIPPGFFQQFFPQDPDNPGHRINEDLLPYFNPFPYGGTQGDTLSSGGLYGTWQSEILGASMPPETFDVDLAIDQYLFWLMHERSAGTLDPAVQADADKLGRLRQIFESVAGALRGEANGVLISRWDADPSGTIHPTYSDSIVNSERDGRNQRWFIEIPSFAEQVAFTIRVDVPSRPYVDGFRVDVPITAAGVGQFAKFDVDALRELIETSLEAALGVNWPKVDDDRGVVDVRSIEEYEVDGRTNTAWEIPIMPEGFFSDWNFGPDPGSPNRPDEFNTPVDHGATLLEIRFQGELHDVPIELSLINPMTAFWVQDEPSAPSADQAPTYPPPRLVRGQDPVEFEGDTQGFEGTSQYNSSIAITSDGDLVSAYTQEELTTDQPMSGWDGDPLYNDDGTIVSQNILYRQLQESTDTAGPRVADLTDAQGRDITPNIKLAGSDLRYLILTFNEEMMAGDPATNPDSVLNPRNYRILDGAGNELPNGIGKVEYGLSMVAQVADTYGLNPIPSNKWEVILILDSDAVAAGYQPLSDGTYTLQVRHAIPESSTTAGQTGLRDRAGNPLYRTGYIPGGRDYQMTFMVNTTIGGGRGGSPDIGETDTPINPTQRAHQNSPTVATNSNGDYVVVWVSYVAGNANIVGQRYDVIGDTVGPEFIINTYVRGSQIEPRVAMDAAGNFVVVWSGAGANTNNTNNTSDIFAQRFDALGRTVGQQFLVNQYLPGIQNMPSVAMDAAGNFVVAWTCYSHTTTENRLGIYARRYGTLGQALGNEFVVSTAKYRQEKPDVAMDASGNFVVTWAADQKDGSSWGIYGRWYTSAGKGNGEFRVNTITKDKQIDPRAAMDPAGNFVVTWASYQPAAKTTSTAPQSGYDIYARRFSAGGRAKDSQEFRVNTVTAYNQITPDVGMDSKGNFTVVWTDLGHDNAEVNNPAIKDYGVYARMYNANGSDFVDSQLGKMRAFRVNASVRGHQMTPAIDRSGTGDSVIVWVGPDSSGNGIFSRTVAGTSAAATAVKTTSSTTTSTASSTAAKTAAKTTTAVATPAKPAAKTTTAAATPAKPVAAKTSVPAATTVIKPATKTTVAAATSTVIKPATSKLVAPSSTSTMVAPSTASTMVKLGSSTAVKSVAAPPPATVAASLPVPSAKATWLIDAAQAAGAKNPPSPVLNMAVDQILAARN